MRLITAIIMLGLSYQYAKAQLLFVWIFRRGSYFEIIPRTYLIIFVDMAFVIISIHDIENHAQYVYSQATHIGIISSKKKT